MSRSLRELSGQDLAWLGLADNLTNYSPVKVALSNAKYVDSILFDGRKWVGKARSKLIGSWSGKKKKERKKMKLPCLNNYKSGSTTTS